MTGRATIRDDHAPHQIRLTQGQPPHQQDTCVRCTCQGRSFGPGKPLVALGHLPPTDGIEAAWNIWKAHLT